MKTSRRHFLLLTAVAGVATASPAKAAVNVLERVAAVELLLKDRATAGKPVSADIVLASLGTDLLPVEMRIAIFELVRRVPYKLTTWTGDPMSLFVLGRGDCRHKSAAATLLLKRAGYVAEHRVVTFNWADLPIPREMLSILTDTKSFHDTVRLQLGGKWVLFDATWDPALGRIGFPVLERWDGSSSTRAVTSGATVMVVPSDIPAGSNMYERYGVRWPNRTKTLAFNRQFNAWSDEIRQRSSSPSASLR